MHTLITIVDSPCRGKEMKSPWPNSHTQENIGVATFDFRADKMALILVPAVIQAQH
ncbi:hypothetical protein HMPREF0620_0322 [Parascardovia denticolens DSM 10105 = JCM 12538]|uniref:Uncharacterized protein n=1 Tax=Parascardovia denticolens DSM 10105 = JCM 12538 TaxID=864564 RepID=E6K0H9_PARDN|nr:hypothetical protein HMPREF0620_0322 [Parascardovia denticolens DSM 10105 = JCM 12538]BAR05785.1 hypothetical protein PSDT_1266 [Parascardovia denticolens DSM 10105 = JCM 12538]